MTRVGGNATIILEKDGKKLIPKVNIYESSRKFEKILIGKKVEEIPDLVSRICGICHVPHKLGGIMAIEDALNVKVGKEIEMLRELLNLGSLMNSHVLHLFFMVLPDIKEHDNIFEMTNNYKNLINKGLKLEKVSEEIVKVVGGREVHTLTPKIGGFTKFPGRKDLNTLLKNLKEARKDALEAIKVFSENKKDLKFKKKTRHISLKGNKNYEVLKGDLIADGFDFSAKEYGKFLKEYEVDYSTAKFSEFNNKSYMVGALSRLINNGDNLPAKIKKYLKNLELNSPFSNNLAQTIEVYYCIERAIEIIENLKLREKNVDFKYKESEGISVTEAPRGILVHHYKIGKNGKVKYANIITPTAQNLKSMEDSATEFIPSVPKKDLEHFLERLIRAYDPCTPCSTHFLDVRYNDYL